MWLYAYMCERHGSNVNKIFFFYLLMNCSFISEILVVRINCAKIFFLTKVKKTVHCVLDSFTYLLQIHLDLIQSRKVWWPETCVCLLIYLFQLNSIKKLHWYSIIIYMKQFLSQILYEMHALYYLMTTKVRLLLFVFDLWGNFIEKEQWTSPFE